MTTIYIEDTVPFDTQDAAIAYAEKMRKDYTLTVLGPYWQGAYWIVDVRRRVTQEEVHAEEGT